MWTRYLRHNGFRTMDGIKTTVRSIDHVGPTTVAVTLVTPLEFSGQPGHFIQFRLPDLADDIVRHYSISSPTVGSTLTITVTVNPDGELTPHLLELMPGSIVEIAGPFGRTYYEDELNVLVISEGPGTGVGSAIVERTLMEGGNAAIIACSPEPIFEKRLSDLSMAGGLAIRVKQFTDTAFHVVTKSTVFDEEPVVYIFGFQHFVDTVLMIVESDRTIKVENFG